MSKRPVSVQNPWMRRQLDLPSEEQIRSRGVTPDDIAYLRKYRFPFLQISNHGSPLDTNDPFVTLKAPSSGWIICDEANSLSSSPGFGGVVDTQEEKKSASKDDKEEGEEGDGDGTDYLEPKGTLINQTVMTAFDMVTIAIAKGWDAINIVDGSDLMQWAAWAATQDAGVKAYGFTASEQDKKKYDRLQRVTTEGSLIRPGPGMNRP